MKEGPKSKVTFAHNFNGGDAHVLEFQTYHPR
jgi:hypothetical protein